MLTWDNRRKLIKQKHKDLLRGWTRPSASNAINIPDEIIQICILFYLIVEEWNENGKGKTIEIMNESATICECMDDSYQMISGSIICKRNVCTFHRWTLKLLKYNPIKYWNNVVGIVDTKRVDPCITDFGDNIKRDGTYFFIGYSKAYLKPQLMKAEGSKFNYGESVNKENDIIEMVLDLKRGTLGFIINGTDYGVARDDIQIDGEYCMFITVNGKGTSFEILSYKNE